MGAINVGREIEQVHLEQWAHNLIGARAVAEVGGTAVRSTGQSLDFDREHSLQRWAFVLDADVGRREPQLTADLDVYKRQLQDVPKRALRRAACGGSGRCGVQPVLEDVEVEAAEILGTEGL